MRISDWSSDVCSSDLARSPRPAEPPCTETKKFRLRAIAGPAETPAHLLAHDQNRTSRTRTLKAPTTIKPQASSSMHTKQVKQPGNRKSIGAGKRGTVRVDLGCSRLIKKKNNNKRR